MLIAEYAPLTAEKLLVGSIMIFVTSGLLGMVVTRFQRSYRRHPAWAWLIWIVGMSAVIALQGFFQIAERLAPLVQPYMRLFGIMGLAVSVVFWTLCFYTLFGGKLSAGSRQ